MQELKKEGIIVSSFVLLCILDKINVPFIGIAILFILPVVIGLLIYVGITSTDFKTGKLQVIFSIYYKMFLIIKVLKRGMLKYEII